MRKYRLIFFIASLQYFALPVHAGQNQVETWRFWTAPDHTRVVFDVTDRPEYQLMVLENPHRLVVDFKNANLRQTLPLPPKNHKLFTGIRSSLHDSGGLRVVIDLKNAVKAKSFTLKPNKNYGHRLVIDLVAKKTTEVLKPQTITKSVNNDYQDFVVAIDAGHGGEDPGARGFRGTREKDVVLAIARKLRRLVAGHPGMRPVMVRDGDYYVGLRNRMAIARKVRADLFISIHADAFKNSRVQGASVYTLSRRGASSEAARWLANHENAADLVGGVSLDDKDDVLASVLLDLSQTATQDASLELAKEVLSNFTNIGKLHKRSVQKAGFLVLKSPDIPSILVETAYISNPTEEQKLRSERHQEKIARAIFKGIAAYYHHHLPGGVYRASTRHVISRGETLSGIAMQYGVSMKQLMMVNGLSSEQIRIGQVLSIPRS